MSIRKYWPITEKDVYVRVFDEILDELDVQFFDPALVESYRGLRPESRYLVTRMFLRAPKWIRIEDFEKYMSRETLAESVLPELVNTQWVSGNPPLARVVGDVATQKELATVAKDLNLKIANQTRQQLANKLIQLEKQQAFFNPGRTATKITSQLSIECYYLLDSRRDFLRRLEQMFLYPVGPDATLEVVFLTYMKKQAFFPYQYLTQCEAPLFKSQRAFAAYHAARDMCEPLELALATASDKLPASLADAAFLAELEHGMLEATQDPELGQAARVYGRGVFNASQVLMKMHRFTEEYEWIRKYLDVTGHKSKRGVALIRKLLLELRFLDGLGTKGESTWLVSAVNTYYDAMGEVSAIERVDLERKTSKLISSIQSSGLKSALAFVQPSARVTSSTGIPVKTIVAAPVLLENAKRGPGTRLTYADGFDVEQTALRHYEDYRGGGHFENSMMLTIFWLLCWDLLFSDPAEFRCKFQSHPLNVQGVIDRHKDVIAARLDSPDVVETIRVNRQTLVDLGDPRPMVGAINWNIPESSAMAVVEGLGLQRTKLILMRIAEDYYHHSSGFPDLTLWDPQRKHTKFVEVKSEHDTVSDNQQLWMEFLLSIGADVEICKVVPEHIAPKRKRRK